MMADQQPRQPYAGGAPYLCTPFLTALPISGASVSAISSAGAQSTLCSTDEIAARIDELQFELGEGPQWLAARTGNVVLIADVRTNTHESWPVFASALGELSVGALFSIPLKMGAVTLGAATLYREMAGELSEDQQTSALAIGSAIALTTAQKALRSADEEEPESEAAPALRREVHQATGMIMVQLDTTATIAYSRLQAYAFANQLTLRSVAHDVVTGTLTFNDQTP